MKKVKTEFSALLILLFASSLYGQDSLKIEEQFDRMYTQSNNYQEYKVVEKNRILQLKKNVLDSLTTYGQAINRLQSEIDSQKIENDLLKQQTDRLQTQLQTAISRENELHFLGLPTTKTSYSIVVWSIIAGLLIMALFFLLKNRKNAQMIKVFKQKISEIEAEFDRHRQRSLEKEQQLSRKLLDEQMKNAKQ